MRLFERTREALRWCLVVSLLFLVQAAAFATGSRPSASEATSPPSDRDARIALVTGNVFSGSEARETMRALCDDIGGRLTGTEGAEKALVFAVGLLERYGLQNVHREPYELRGWFRGPIQCEVVAPEKYALHALELGSTPSTPRGGMQAEIIDAAHGNPIELDRLGDKLKGKLALVLDEPMPGGRWMHRSEVMLEVVKRGAAGLLYQSTQPGQLPMTGTCWPNGTSPVPAAGISKEDGEWIRGYLARGEKVVAHLEMRSETKRITSANVVGEIPGTSDEFVIVGAHIDSWDIAQGAVDNGTGAVVILEAARALAKSGVRPKASIRFVLFTGEELGLCGSIAYATAHEAELPRCRAMINCDMVGTPLGLRVMGHEEARPFFETLLASLKSFELTSGVSTRAGIHGDQQAFLLRGVPVVAPISRIGDESVRYYHTWGDTYDKVEFASLPPCAAFVAAVALELASPETRPVEALDEAAVRKMIHDNNLEDALKAWEEASKVK